MAQQHILFKAALSENIYSLARDLITIPSVACHVLLPLKHRRPTAPSKARDEIKGPFVDGRVRKALCSVAEQRDNVSRDGISLLVGDDF